jgi:hypothetical protein
MPGRVFFTSNSVVEIFTCIKTIPPLKKTGKRMDRIYRINSDGKTEPEKPPDG